MRRKTGARLDETHHQVLDALAELAEEGVVHAHASRLGHEGHGGLALGLAQGREHRPLAGARGAAQRVGERIGSDDGARLGCRARWGGAARRIAHAVPSMPCPCCARHAVDGTTHAVPCRAQGRGREKGRSGKLASRLDCALVRTSVDVRICSSPLRGYAAAHSHSAECRAPSAAEGSAPVSRGRTYRKIGRGHQCSASRKGSTDLDMRP